MIEAKQPCGLTYLSRLTTAYPTRGRSKHDNFEPAGAIANTFLARSWHIIWLLVTSRPSCTAATACWPSSHWSPIRSPSSGELTTASSWRSTGRRPTEESSPDRKIAGSRPWSFQPKLCFSWTMVFQVVLVVQLEGEAVPILLRWIYRWPYELFIWQL